MPENQPITEIAVDRREETVTTHQPGYAATEQVTHDVAAERRLGLFQFTRIIGWISGVVMPTEQDLQEAGVYLGEMPE